MSMTTDLRRVTILQPGYDCIRTPCGKRGCGTVPSATHGIHSDEWVYAVVGPEIALVLVVFSGVYPSTVPKELVQSIHARDDVRDQNRARGAGLDLHTTFPCSREAVLRGTPTTAECDFLDAPCFCEGGSVLGAGEFFQKHGVDRYDQPEMFWQALSAQWKEWADEALANRADRQWQQCPHCKGEGTLPR